MHEGNCRGRWSRQLGAARVVAALVLLVAALGACSSEVAAELGRLESVQIALFRVVQDGQRIVMTDNLPIHVAVGYVGLAALVGAVAALLGLREYTAGYLLVGGVALLVMLPWPVVRTELDLQRRTVSSCTMVLGLFTLCDSRPLTPQSRLVAGARTDLEKDEEMGVETVKRVSVATLELTGAHDDRLLVAESKTFDVGRKFHEVADSLNPRLASASEQPSEPCAPPTSSVGAWIALALAGAFALAISLLIRRSGEGGGFGPVPAVVLAGLAVFQPPWAQQHLVAATVTVLTLELPAKWWRVDESLKIGGALAAGAATVVATTWCPVPPLVVGLVALAAVLAWQILRRTKELAALQTPPPSMRLGGASPSERESGIEGVDQAAAAWQLRARNGALLAKPQVLSLRCEGEDTDIDLRTVQVVSPREKLRWGTQREWHQLVGEDAGEADELVSVAWVPPAVDIWLEGEAEPVPHGFEGYRDRPNCRLVRTGTLWAGAAQRERQGVVGRRHQLVLAAVAVAALLAAALLAPPC